MQPNILAMQPNNLATQPNILLIHADQHRLDCVHGVTGIACAQPLLRTPGLARIAGEGVAFSHAFTPIAICSPARASLMTGAWPTTHGCQTIPHCCEWFASARADLPVLTTLLAGAGYDIGWVGKFHSEVAGGPEQHGVRRFVSAAGYGKWREGRGIAPQARGNGWFGEWDEGITAGEHTLAWQAGEVIEMLRTRDRGRPMFLRWDPPEPHLPNRPPAEMRGTFPEDRIVPWAGFGDSLAGKPPAQKRTRQRWGTDGWDWENWRPIVARYLADVTLLDRQVGRLLDALDAEGIAEQTLVIYSCDHGDMCGSHGMMDKHYCMYDDIMRVPLLMRWPGRVRAGRVCGSFVCNELDIARTLLTAAGASVPKSFVGGDLVALANGREPNPRPDIYAQYFGTQQGLYSSRMLRTREHKYVFNPAGVDELYDVVADPGELVNLADRPGHAELLRRLRERMGEWMKQVRDPLSAPLYQW
jgi:arylsulfatase A-like enzyme